VKISIMDGDAVRDWRDKDLLTTAIPITLLQTAFFAAPLLMTVLLTFQRTRNYRLDWSWDLAVWSDVLSRPHYWTILGHTLVMAALCVVLCIAIAYPIAYALATRLRHWDNEIKVLITFAFLTDATLKTYGWVLFLDRNGAANYLLEHLGLPPGSVSILYTDWATLVGMVYNLLPFAIFTLYLSISDIDRSLILAAYDAGASKIRAHWEITLPLSRPGLWAGSVLIFLLGVGVFLEPKVLGGGKSPMSAELIRQTFETRVNWPLGAALTLVVMIVSIFVVLLFTRIIGVKRVGR
jgi:spermidine/putrescine transport system permease protein